MKLKTLLQKDKSNIVYFLYALLSLFSLITTIVYNITRNDGKFFDMVSFLWLITMVTGCVLAVFYREPRWIPTVFLVSVVLYALLYIVSSFLLMIAMGAITGNGMVYFLLRGFPLCLVFVVGCIMGFSKIFSDKNMISSDKKIIYVFAIFAVLLSLLVTIYGLCFGGVFYNSSFEYWQFIHPMVWLGIAMASFGWALAKRMITLHQMENGDYIKESLCHPCTIEQTYLFP